MLKNPAIDPGVLKLLKKYSKLTQEYFAGGCVDISIEDFANDRPTSPDEMARLLEAKVAFAQVSMTHDEAIAACFSSFKPAHKKKIVRQFVAGLGTSRPELRSGLSAFAMMQTMPNHQFSPNRAGFCEVCSSRRVDSSLDLTTLSRERYFLGALPLAPKPFEIQSFLSQQELLAAEVPTRSDISLLNAVLNTARHAEPSFTPTKLQKAVKSIEGLKLDNHQARRVVETLGYCGILQTKGHPGYLETWTSPGLAPSKPSSDWAYPVDFWTGKDGVNEEAVDFWFGSILD